jgi:hypothetical protein
MTKTMIVLLTLLVGSFVGTFIWLLTQAQGAEYRTVSWYADHVSETQRVLQICRDHAGVAQHNPNCINADEAQILIVQRQMRFAGTVGNPRTPRYWHERPLERDKQIWICDSIDQQHAKPDAMTAQLCAAARGG